MCATKTSLTHQTSRLAANDLGRFAQAASFRLTLPDRTFHTTTTFAQGGLSEILKTEAEYEKENYEEPEEVVQGPPSPWKLSEKPKDTHMTLSRSHNGEQIQVDIMVNDQPDDPAEAFENDDGEVDVQADVGVVFSVSVIKGEDSLVFECQTDGQYIDIQHVSLEKTGEDLDESVYTGPVYSELDENLQKQFEQYLSDRGINLDLGAYLLAKVHDKEQKEYCQWLEDVRKFTTK